MNTVSDAAPRRGVPARTRDHALLAVGAAVALLLALSFVEGTYALWTDSAQTEGLTATTGTAELVVAWAPGHDEGFWAALLPGEAVQREFSLTNTGDADLEIHVAVEGATSAEARVLSVSCGNGPLGIGVAGGASQPFATPHDTTTAIVLGSAESVQGCVDVQLTGAAQPGQTIDLVLRFDGEQVTR